METKPTLDELLAVLDYNPDTGDILKRDGKRQRDQWVIAGSLHPHGYRFIQVNSGRFGAHRIAWVFLTGRWAPDDKVVERWQARIRSGGKSVSLGYFKTPEEGAAAYAAAANAMNGEFARNESVGAGKESLRGGPRKIP